MDKKIEDFDKKYAENKIAQEKEYFSPYRTITHFFNTAALISFLLGIGFFVIYIILVQTHDFKETFKHNQEVSQMSMKKTAGKTEAKQSLASQVINLMEGKTEMPAPVLQTKGKTELPQPAIIPNTPAVKPAQQQGNSGNSQTTKE